jgi:prepilin signal peptidase PulO-like enzyme (type II secretory pathway)
MDIIVWTVTALAVVSLLVYVIQVRRRTRLPKIELPPGEKMPKTHLQRYAGWTLLEVSFLTALAAGIVVVHGPEVWWEHDRVRLTVTLVLLTALVTYLVFYLGIRKLKAKSEALFDERDRVILNRSGAGAGGAMMVVMAAWMITLVEAYNDTGLVPSYFLYLIFWSMVMTNVIASLADILLAYRRS